MANECKKCGKKIFYATVCPYCGTVQKVIDLAKFLQDYFLSR